MGRTLLTVIATRLHLHIMTPIVVRFAHPSDPTCRMLDYPYSGQSEAFRQKSISLLLAGIRWYRCMSRAGPWTRKELSYPTETEHCSAQGCHGRTLKRHGSSVGF